MDVKFLTFKGKRGEKVRRFQYMASMTQPEFVPSTSMRNIIRHAHFKRGTPQLNGRAERSHRSDQQEFYQLLSYKDDVDLEAKLDECERYCNFARLHSARNGQTPYEALRDKLQ